jgi:hypothetical protein
LTEADIVMRAHIDLQQKTSPVRFADHPPRFIHDLKISVRPDPLIHLDQLAGFLDGDLYHIHIRAERRLPVSNSPLPGMAAVRRTAPLQIRKSTVTRLCRHQAPPRLLVTQRMPSARKVFLQPAQLVFVFSCFGSGTETPEFTGDVCSAPFHPKPTNRLRDRDASCTALELGQT